LPSSISQYVSIIKSLAAHYGFRDGAIHGDPLKATKIENLKILKDKTKASHDKFFIIDGKLYYFRKYGTHSSEYYDASKIMDFLKGLNLM
jgi:hypothetical protein